MWQFACISLFRLEVTSKKVALLAERSVKGGGYQHLSANFFQKSTTFYYWFQSTLWPLKQIIIFDNFKLGPRLKKSDTFWRKKLSIKAEGLTLSRALRAKSTIFLTSPPSATHTSAWQSAGVEDSARNERASKSLKILFIKN